MFFPFFCCCMHVPCTYGCLNTSMFFVCVGTPNNIKRRRHYPPDIKRVIYAMCLERSAPGIKDVPLRQCHTVRDLANALHMPKSTLHDRLKEGKFRRHTNAIKFTLTEQNMKERVRFCVNMLDSQSIRCECNGQLHAAWEPRRRATQVKCCMRA